MRPRDSGVVVVGVISWNAGDDLRVESDNFVCGVVVSECAAVEALGWRFVFKNGSKDGNSGAGAY